MTTVTLIVGRRRGRRRWAAKGALGAALRRAARPIGNASPMTSRRACEERAAAGGRWRHALVLHRLRGVMDRLANPDIGRAAADIARHAAVDILVGRLRLGGEQADRRHHLARLAETALRHVDRDPGGLDRLGARVRSRPRSWSPCARRWCRPASRRSAGSCRRDERCRRRTGRCRSHIWCRSASGDRAAPRARAFRDRRRTTSVVPFRRNSVAMQRLPVACRRSIGATIGISQSNQRGVTAF